MQERPKQRRMLRREKLHWKPMCPVCQIQMKRKGKKGSFPYYKCPKCKGRMNIDGEYFPPPNPDTIDLRNQELKVFRKEIAKRKLIKRLKKQKYLGYSSIQYNGEIIDLNAYDKNGNPLEEQKVKSSKEERSDVH